MTEYISMNPQQVKNILKYIEDTQSDEVKCSVFTQLGHECFFAGRTVQWIEGYRGNVQKLLDEVNIENKSRHWERLEFNEDRTQLILTGREVENCVCAFADCDEPPVSLCTHCCKHFQTVMFSHLFEQKVDVEITESYLTGGKRCSTQITLIHES